ncbi:MAG: hypothetical protein U0807_17865 [Candidatus Binatia bacterium]
MTQNSKRCRIVLAGALVAATLGIVPGTYAMSRMSSDGRMLVRCQRTISREGLLYAHYTSMRVERCLRAMDECRIAETSGGATCRVAGVACGSVDKDLADLESRFRRDAMAACQNVPVAQITDGLGFSLPLGDCTIVSAGDVVACLAGKMRMIEGVLFSHLEPLACAAVLKDATAGKALAECCTTESSGGGNDGGGTCEGTLFCGGAEAVACPEGMVCDRQDALCGSAPASGVCVPAPASCAAGSAVCGCDGTTYASDCDRLMAGATKAMDGSCAPAPQACGPGSGTPDCPSGMFCEYPAGDCGEGGVGTCRPQGSAGCDMCSAYAGGTQCGCDGTTYANDCARERAGTSRYFNGPCW